MKVKFTSLFLILGILLPAIASAQRISVTQADALEIAKRQFQGQDVDYLIRDNDHPTDWTIFVDAEPMKGWAHDCYILTIPKLATVPVKILIPSQIEKRDMPPMEDDFVPLEVKNRYGDNIDSNHHHARVGRPAQIDNPVAGRTYAVILSGGINKYSNHYRYWNDCSFIYQTLVNKYGVPKGNIYPIMSDGDDPEEDMEVWNYATFISQPLDLDFDGEDETILAATKDNVRMTLETLAGRLQKDDHLHFFVIDHGLRYEDVATGSYENNSQICLWTTKSMTKEELENRDLKDYELARMLDPICSKGVNVSVVLGQCFSGGFIDDLSKIGCVVATASAQDEGSWMCSDIEYDEFVYHWICAVNEANHRGVKINSDIDNNGRVTMEEAFLYAKNNDRKKEHPQYASTPVSIGEDLAFNHLPPAVDLYIMDNPEDTGKEPNLTTDKFWISPSVCVRNNPDKVFVHQNPEYSSDHKKSYIYVRVHNRGKEKFDGTGKWIAAYWAEASTGISTRTWKGVEILENGYPKGGYVGSGQIGAVNPGEFVDIEIPWTLPAIMESLPDGNFHFCLLAKIMDTGKDDLYQVNKSYFDLKGSNDQAQKNVIIVKSKDLNKEYNILVRNLVPVDASYSLELVPRTDSDNEFFNRAKVSMTMGKTLSDAWEKGGSEFENIEIPATIDNQNELKTVNFVSPKGKLLKIALKANERDAVKLKFDFTKNTGTKATYTLDLIQKNSQGEIVGGETFIVDALVFSGVPIDPIIDVDPIPAIDPQFRLSVSKPEFASYQWLNEQGEVIGENDNVTVIPNPKNKSFSVVAVTEDGEMFTDSIDLSYPFGIKSIAVADNNIIVELKCNSQNNTSLEIVSVLDGEIKQSHIVPSGINTLTLDVSNLHKGYYIVGYRMKDEIIDRQRIKL